MAQVRLLERRASSRPGTPTSNASTDTPTPSEHNDGDDDLMDVEEEVQGSEPESATPHLKKPFQLLIAAAMERNPTQFQLPSELTCTTSLPGKRLRIIRCGGYVIFVFNNSFCACVCRQQ